MLVPRRAEILEHPAQCVYGLEVHGHRYNEAVGLSNSGYGVIQGRRSIDQFKVGAERRWGALGYKHHSAEENAAAKLIAFGTEPVQYLSQRALRIAVFKHDPISASSQLSAEIERG